MSSSANSVSDTSDADRAGGGNENLSSTKKFKNLTRPKKPTLTKTNSSRTDFLIFKAKEVFINL